MTRSRGENKGGKIVRLEKVSRHFMIRFPPPFSEGTK
jgi:hypothetical protein